MGKACNTHEMRNAYISSLGKTCTEGTTYNTKAEVAVGIQK
jgi:hypothetical protein